MVLWLHYVVSSYRGKIPSWTAAQLLAILYFDLREQMAGRSGDIQVYDQLLVGATGIDYKKPPGTSGRSSRPMFASRTGIDGTCDWSREFMYSIQPLGDEAYMVRDVNTPSGGPLTTTAFVSPAGECGEYTRLCVYTRAYVYAFCAHILAYAQNTSA